MIDLVNIACLVCDKEFDENDVKIYFYVANVWRKS